MVFERIRKEILDNKFDIISFDGNRPWGGFFVLSENQSQEFANMYFSGLDVSILGKISPKILVVSPLQRLSWQYHNRRSEIWCVIQGKVGIKRSFDDIEGDLIILEVGDTITLEQGERHRLIGLGDYSVIAEIWQHTDIDYPSNEDDIIRLQDDFGR